MITTESGGVGVVTAAAASSRVRSGVHGWAPGAVGVKSAHIERAQDKNSVAGETRDVLRLRSGSKLPIATSFGAHAAARVVAGNGRGCNLVRPDDGACSETTET